VKNYQATQNFSKKKHHSVFGSNDSELKTNNSNSLMPNRPNSGVFKGGARCDAPLLVRPWKFFTADFIWKGAGGWLAHAMGG